MYNLIILGSGRSGTSMLAGSFSESGYFQGDQANYLGQKSSNPKGFFEDKEVNLINEDILKQNVLNIPEPIRKRFLASHTYYKVRWMARIPGKKTIINKDVNVNVRIQAIVQQAPFCYKDPRFSYTLPIWKPFLTDNTRYVVVFREPSKTVNSIKRHYIESRAAKRLRKLKIDNEIASKIWLYMYEHILKNYQSETNKDQWHFIHYNQMFDTHAISKLNTFTGASINKNFADQGISRSKNTSMQFNAHINEVYHQLCLLASYTE